MRGASGQTPGGCSRPFGVGACRIMSAGWHGHRCCSSSLSHHPGWTHPSGFLLWWWLCQRSWEGWRGEQGTLYLGNMQGSSSVAAGRPPTSVLESRAGSQELVTAALLMTGGVVLGNSLGCLWVSSPVSKKGMILLCNLLLKWLVSVLQMSRSCHVFLPLVWRGPSAFFKKPWLQEHKRLWGLFCLLFFSC